MSPVPRFVHRVTPDWRRLHRISPGPTPRRRFAALGYHFTSRSRCAARFVHLTGARWTDAAAMFGVNAGGVFNAYRRIYKR